MDIAALSTGLAQTKLLRDVGTAVLAKSLDQATMIGDSMTQLLDTAAMERSVCPDLGQNIDISV